MDRVALTARWTAAARACESIRPDRLFEDPLAAALAGPEGFALQAQVDGPAGNPTLPIRTRFFDDFLRRVVAEAPVRQVVLVAAGMDTRALRLPWPAGTRLFELDRPDLLTAKDTVLSALQATPRCRRYPVGIDLQDDWEQPLGAAGYRPEQQSMWLLEGLLLYLEAAAVHQLLEQVAANAMPGSWLGADLINRAFFTSPYTQPWLQALASAGLAWHFGTDEPEGLLAAHGWTATVTETSSEGVRHGRWPYPTAREITGLPQSFLVTVQRAG